MEIYKATKYSDPKKWVEGQLFDKPLRYGRRPYLYVESEDEEINDIGWVEVLRDTLKKRTPFKDKNGNWIYADDIVLCKGYIPMIQNKDTIYQVQFINGGWFPFILKDYEASINPEDVEIQLTVD